MRVVLDGTWMMDGIFGQSCVTVEMSGSSQIIVIAFVMSL